MPNFNIDYSAYCILLEVRLLRSALKKRLFSDGYAAPVDTMQMLAEIDKMAMRIRKENGGY